jgi:hypothetical protein
MTDPVPRKKGDASFGYLPHNEPVGVRPVRSMKVNRFLSREDPEPVKTGTADHCQIQSPFHNSTSITGSPVLSKLRAKLDDLNDACYYDRDYRMAGGSYLWSRLRTRLGGNENPLRDRVVVVLLFCESYAS